MSVRLSVSALVCSMSFLGIASIESSSAATIAAVSVTNDVTDFGPSGLNIGKSGSWFANFDASAPVDDAPVDQDDVNTLPSWLAVNFNPNVSGYSFPRDNGDGKPYAVSMGGFTGFNQFTLPDGATGLSGQLVDVRMATGQSDTLIKDLTFGVGSPESIIFHVVLDNAPLDQGTAVSRVRATYRMPVDGNTIVRALFDIPAEGNNGIADVYTFRLDGIDPTGWLAVQLVTTSSTKAAGVGGFAFDPVPEPSTVNLALLGTTGIVAAAIARRMRRRQLLKGRSP